MGTVTVEPVVGQYGPKAEVAASPALILEDYVHLLDDLALAAGLGYCYSGEGLPPDEWACPDDYAPALLRTLREMDDPEGFVAELEGDRGAAFGNDPSLDDYAARRDGAVAFYCSLRAFAGDWGFWIDPRRGMLVLRIGGQGWG